MFDDKVPTMLWEAIPSLFAARYPDSGIEEPYGDEWSGATCIDYWIYIDTQKMTAHLSVEAWSGPDPSVAVSGDGPADGQVMAAAFAHVLSVPFPVGL